MTYHPTMMNYANAYELWLDDFETIPKDETHNWHFLFWILFFYSICCSLDRAETGLTMPCADKLEANEWKWHLRCFWSKEVGHMSKFCLICCRYDADFFSFHFLSPQCFSSSLVFFSMNSCSKRHVLTQITSRARETKSERMCKKRGQETKIKRVSDVWINDIQSEQIGPSNEACYPNRRLVIWVENRCKWNRNMHEYNFHLCLKGNTK